MGSHAYIAKQRSRREGGFSLLEALVALALFLTMLTGLYQALGNSAIAAKRSEVASSIRQFEDAFRTQLWTRLRGYIRGGCASRAAFQSSLASVTFGDFGRFRLKPDGVNLPAQPGDDPQRTAARARCNRAMVVPPHPASYPFSGGPVGSNDGTFYFCVTIEPLGTPRASSALAASGPRGDIFAEVYVGLRDSTRFSSNVDLTCANFLNGSGVAYGYYSIYLTRESAVSRNLHGRQQTRRVDGVFYGAN
jgi:hypothetical protein